MSAPVEARHRGAVESLCELLLALSRSPDHPETAMVLGQGVLLSIGHLALDPQGGSEANSHALLAHGESVVRQWAEAE